jgi:predicted metalloprotease with PDZ domain
MSAGRNIFSRAMVRPGAAALAILWAATAASGTQAVPPSDRPYPGIIELDVDATNVGQKIFRVHESIPVKAGPLTLLYPQWRLGTHAPAGLLLSQFAGLMLEGNQRRIDWRRDPLDMYAFQVDVPAGVHVLEADFQFLSPLENNQGAILATPEMLAVHWEALLLYPAGFFARGITVEPRLVVPPGWQYAGALESGAGSTAGAVHFKPVHLDELIDSPIYAGRWFKRVDLDPGATVPVFLDMFADGPQALEATPEQLAAHRALVQQAYKLFGSHHYDHYDFLMALSDEFSFPGLEHQQSGENGVRTTYFSEWARQQSWRSGLVSHEYTHSWDGKFRRPADQLTANYNVPMQDSLLWVYEGGTSYWGHVLGARSGLVEVSQMRDALAATAALYEHRIGRSWRNLQDTTNEPIITNRGPLGWVSWQRAEDYYSEGELIWFDADTKIRELSGDRRSLDDFARGFFGIKNGSHEPVPYTFEDVVHALDAVQPFDWAGFMRARLDGHGPAPLDGLARSGWKLVYGEEPSPFFKDAEDYRKLTDFVYSLGFSVGADGRIGNVLWEGPAFKAGLTAGYTLLAVDGRAYRPELLKSAITAAKSSPDPIELLLRKDDRFRTVRLDYHEGLKYPQLMRQDGPDRLARIFAPL